MKKIDFKGILQFITYALVGLSNVIIDIIVLNILWKISGHYIGHSNYLFKFISFSIYSTTGYLLNLKFTFNTKASFKSYISYVSLLAVLAFIDAILLVKISILNPLHLSHELAANSADLFAAMATGVFGFIINKILIFKKNSLVNVTET